ncbi:hypothetical protein [Paraburkholderia phenoliruptrix]|nr:hypothetical protein [Paraburkholderia phenoliruptrix]WMY09611.1 hypothetical protein P3F88_07555 [Paraburkholderia phenoliruptrix]
MDIPLVGQVYGFSLTGARAVSPGPRSLVREVRARNPRSYPIKSAGMAV